MTDDAAGPETPRGVMPAETLVMDVGSGRQLLRIAGFMPLPVGARIELGPVDPPAADAVVTKVRVWGASGPRPLLVLDVMMRPPGEDADLP